MKQRQPHDDGPCRLADHLAELLRQFRHFSGGPPPDPALATHLARLRISARLLSAVGGDNDPHREGFVRLGGVLEEWVATFPADTESFPPHLVRPLERLADDLEDVLVGWDRGRQAADLAGDPGWDTLLAVFRRAGTPLAALEEIDDQLRRWSGRWNEENLTPAQVQQLTRRWDEIKLAGDRLFNGVAFPAEVAPGADRSARKATGVILLVDSSFRRDQIRDHLTAHGFGVEIPADGADALIRATTGSPPTAILCDHLEPTRHLAHLSEGLAATPARKTIPLVLVASGSRSFAADQARAVVLGAGAAWCEPYRADDLRRILQRLSQP